MDPDFLCFNLNLIAIWYLQNGNSRGIYSRVQIVNQFFDDSCVFETDFQASNSQFSQCLSLQGTRIIGLWTTVQMRYIYVVLAYTKLSKIIVITVSTVSSLFLLPVAIYLSSCLLFNYKQPPFPKSEQKNSSGCGPRLNYLNEQQKSFSFIQKQTVPQVLWHANSDSLKRQSKPTRGKYGYSNRRHPAIQSWEPGGRRL